jgi:hypothetical protein
MKPKYITLFGLFGSLLYVVYQFDSIYIFINQKTIYLVIQYIIPLLFIIYFTGSYLKQKNKTTLKTFTLVAGIGQLLIIGNNILRGIGENYYNLSVINNDIHLLETTIEINKIGRVLVILSFIIVLFFFIVLYKSQQRQSSFKNVSLMACIAQIILILVHSYTYYTIYISSAKEHESIFNTLDIIALIAWLLILIFFIIMYYIQNKPERRD